MQPWRCLVLLLVSINLGLTIYQSFALKTSNLTILYKVDLVGSLFASSYTAVLALAYPFAGLIKLHRSLTVHLTTLSAFILLHCYFNSIGQYLSITYRRPISLIEYTVLGITLGQMILVGSIPTGPPLYMRVSNLYSKAVTAATQDAFDGIQPNVNQQVESSVFGNLLYTFVMPLLLQTSSMDQLDIQNIPIPQAWLRSQNILRASVEVNNLGGLRIVGGPTLSLLWTVWGPPWKTILAGTLLLHGPKTMS